MLVVDWDLEAPGLERYFEYFHMSSTTGGLLPRLLDAATEPKAAHPDAYRSHVWSVQIEGGALSLLPSGRQLHSSYAASLEKLDWPEFFAQGGGHYLELVRNQWKQDFDFVLIDSRTGLNDSGGICTIQMPDVLVAMYTANEQSMFGVRDVIEAAQLGRQRLAYDRMQLTIVPVPCRFGAQSEFELANQWLDRIAEVFSSYLNDWIPKGVSPRVVFDHLKIPQIDWFGFGERLAVVEQKVSSPGTMGYAYERLAQLLATQFEDVERTLGLFPEVTARPPASRLSSHSGAHRSKKDDYEYDVFVSYSASGVVGEWTAQFVSELRELPAQQGKRLQFFLDSSGLSVGVSWILAIDDAIRRSRLMLAILTPAYFTSESCIREWAAFQDREHRLGGPLILPVLLRKGFDLPPLAQARSMIDASHTDLARTDFRHSSKNVKLMEELADRLVQMVTRVPPFDPTYKIAIREDDLQKLRLRSPSDRRVPPPKFMK